MPIPSDSLPHWGSWNTALFENAHIHDPNYRFDGSGAWLGIGGDTRNAAEAFLRTYTELEVLALDGRWIQDSVLDCIKHQNSLERLSIGGIRSESLDFLRSLGKLQYLNIDSIPPNCDVSALNQLSELRSVGLGLRSGDLSFLENVHWPRISTLLLASTSAYKPVIFDSLEPITRFESLEYLWLGNCRTADKSLAITEKLPNLTDVFVGSKRWWRQSDLDAVERRGVSVTDPTDETPLTDSMI